MRPGIFKRNTCPIGVDVGSQSVKLIQLQRAAGGVRVLAAATGRLPEGTPTQGERYHQAVTAAIQGAYRSAPFRGKRVVSCLSSVAVHYKNLRLPKMPEEDMASAVQWEAKDRLNLGNEPFSIQYYDAGEVRQGDELRQEVILLAAPTAFIERHVKSLTDAGLTPTAIDAIPGTLLRCFDRGLADGEAQVVIDAGYEGTKVLIFRGRRVLFFKQIPIGGRVLNETVAKHLNLPVTEAAQARASLRIAAGEDGEDAAALVDQGEAEGEDAGRSHVHRAVYEAIRPKVSELAREVGLCLRYYSVTFRGRRPESAVLVGGEATQSGLASMLSEHAGITIATGEPFGWVDLSGVIQTIPTPADMSRWGVAAGLSLRTPQLERARPGVQQQEAAA